MRTKNKLDETQYYVEKLAKAKNLDELQFNLNSFFSSARSITWVLQKEFSDKRGFKEWYIEKQQAMREDSYLRSLIDKRNWSEKEGRIGPESHFLSMKKDSKNPDKVTLVANINPKNWFLYRIEGDTAIFEDSVEYTNSILERLKIIVDEAYKIFWTDNNVKNNIP